MAVPVVLEVAARRAFASAVDWPGWSRGAKTADGALEALIAYGPRYAEVAGLASVAFRPPASLRGLAVVERLTGGSGTEFGVPSASASAERMALDGADLDRAIALLEAAWATFDRAAARAEGTSLRLGPRGGGRQVPKMVEHVHEAEAAYVHQLGVKVPRPATMSDLRALFVGALRRLGAREPFPEPNKVRTPWTARYAVRRSAWHALDHAWEIEDRSG
jgi:hypothetical protein